MENSGECGLKRIHTTRITTEKGSTIADEEEMREPLSPWSKMFHDPVMNVSILAIMGSQTPLDESRVQDVARQMILKHPRLSSIVVGDKRNELKWVKVPEVRLEDHIVVPVIDPTITPGSHMADKYVEDYMYELSKERFQRSSRPLWDLHFLKLKTSKEEGIIIFRAHHSLGDGVTLMSLLLSCSRNVSDPTTLPTFPVRKKKETISSRDDGDGMRNCWRILIWLWWVLVLIWNTSVDALMFLATFCLLSDTNTPVKARSSAVCRPRRFVYRTICLEDIKLVKNMMNVTINDVAIGITQAGLSYYLNRKYVAACTDHDYKVEDKANDNKVKNRLPKNIRLRSLIMVNLRPQGIKDFSETMKNFKEKWGNLVGFFLLPFNIGLQDDPLEYVREAKIIADRRKHSFEAMFTFLSFKIIPKLFGFKVTKLLCERACANTTLVFSNVVGPSEEILLSGHHINVIGATCYGHAQASMITFTSCGNQMALVASVDEDTISDPQLLCDDIIESLRLIKQAVVAHHIV